MEMEIETLSPPEMKAFCEGRGPQHQVRCIKWRSLKGANMITFVGRLNQKGFVTGEVWNDEVSMRLRGEHFYMCRGQMVPHKQENDIDGIGWRTVYYENIRQIQVNKKNLLIAEQ